MDRHDTILKAIAKHLQQRQFHVAIEPRIPTKDGIRIPDLIAWKEDLAICSDVTISSDIAILNADHLNKTNKYDNNDIRDWIRLHNPSPETTLKKIYFSAHVWNWRGAIAQKSYDDLIFLGLTKTNIKWLTICVLKKSYQIWQTYTTHTTRLPVDYQES